MRNWSRPLIVAAVVAISALVASLAPASAAPASTSAARSASVTAAAQSLAGFSAGNIMSDTVFFAKDTMSAAQIQSFLVQRVPSCQSGYTCLKDFGMPTASRGADAMCTQPYTGRAWESAAAIIYNVAQACGINPQVILATLQKEQGLVTHTWPSDWRYTIAMGQGCPDTAACDTQYYGFFNQVYGAAWQFKRYANPPGTSQFFTWYAPGRTWNILYNPNRDCGSSPVYVANQATANLYYYTPYQPNAASLAAGFNEGDGCSSYGNRNFYNYFTDWFGSTQTLSGGPELTSLDTDAHLIALDAAGSLWAYPYSTSGQWGPRAQIGNGFANVRHVVPLGDLDGDRRRDLVVGFTDGSVVLYRGNGARGYATWATLAARWTDAAMATAAGDFDGDGEPDAFTVTGAGDLLLWSGSAGEFRTPRTVGAGWNSMNLISGGVDIDADGVADVLARDASGNLFLYPGDGRGGWKARALVGIGWGGMAAIFSPGDVTGDGVADVLARDQSGRLWRYTGNRSGMLGASAQVGVGWDSMIAVTGSGPSPTGVRALAPGVGDISADGIPDILAQTPAGEMVAYLGDGRGGWKGWRTVLTGWATTDVPLALGDFDRDGDRDLGRITADGSFLLHRGTGTGFEASATTIGSGWGGLDSLVGAIDFDGDRLADVIARTKAGELLLYRGDGRGGWLGAPKTIGTGWGGFTAIVYVGDFDGDRSGDLVARAADGALMLYPTDGSGGWRAAKRIGTGWSDLTSLTGPGDIDGTGGPDVLARAGGDLLVYRGDGKAGWSGSRVIGVGWQSMTRII